jgi:hypothetical protein
LIEGRRILVNFLEKSKLNIGILFLILILI